MFFYPLSSYIPYKTKAWLRGVARDGVGLGGLHEQVGPWQELRGGGARSQSDSLGAGGQWAGGDREHQGALGPESEQEAASLG